MGRTPLVATTAILVVTVLLYTLAEVHLPTLTAFMPAFLAVVWLLDLFTGYLLFSQYRHGGSRRLLLLGCAYLWSSTLVIPLALVFPGLVAPQGLLGATPSSSAWLWVAWHTGYPALIGLALAPWPAGMMRTPGGRGPKRTAVLAGAGVVAGVAFATWLVTTRAADLPVIIHNGDFSVLSNRFGPWIMLINALAIASAATRFRRGAHHGLEAWALVAVVASGGDALLTLLSHARFTLGWYGARVLALVAALVVLAALLREITLLYGRVRSYAEELRGNAEQLHVSAEKLQLHAEELAHRNADLREANALREHLVAVVSHELRTPVGALMGIVGLMREAGEELPRHKVADLLCRSDALTRRLSMLIEDLLAVSTMEHGELHVAPAPVDVAGALRECARTFPMIQCRVACSDDLIVHADPLRLQQILANFVRNSVKYGQPPVTMTAGRVNDAIEIRVRDHGEGVPADFVPRLFDRFTRADEAKAGVMSGSGLGLSIVVTLAAAQGGAVRYEAADPGACFVLTLPAERPAPAPTAQRSTTSGRGRRVSSHLSG